MSRGIIVDRTIKRQKKDVDKLIQSYQQKIVLLQNQIDEINGKITILEDVNTKFSSLESVAQGELFPMEGK